MENTNFAGFGFLALFFLIIVAVWNRNGNGWNNGFNGGFMPWGGDGIGFGASSYGFQNYRATCDAEKTDIINTATTQYRVEQQAAATRELVNSTASATQAKIDFYAYQAERDKNAELQRQVSELKSNAYTTAALAPIKEAIANIRCNMLTRPDVTGIGVACPSQAILNGLGLNSLNGCGGCGCGSNVLV